MRLVSLSKLASLFICFFIFTTIPATCLTHQHPLDSLTPHELIQVQAIVKRSHPTNITFHYVGLEEPEKSEVLAWKANPTKTTLPRRKALAVTRVNAQTHEIIIDLMKNSVLSDKIYTGHGYPTLTLDEQSQANLLPLTYKPFIESVKKRGLNISEVVCSSFTVGCFGEVKSKRIIKLQCFYKNNTVSIYLRPIEGTEIVVDLEEMRIIEYVDREMLPMPSGDGTDYRFHKLKPPLGPRVNGATIYQPGGPGFKVDGSTIKWVNWELHASLDFRVGPIISQASIYDQDQKRYRSVLYRGHISEMFVPYQDPTEDYYFKSFFDSGEFGFGQSTVPLVPQIDCPTNAVFMDGYYADQSGNVVKVPNAFCVFEKYGGDIMWRHTETGIPNITITESRVEATLVVRTVITVGNYDHIIDWKFKPSGSINVEIGLTGILEVKATEHTHVDHITEEVHGTFLGDYTIGLYHDHFITFRLDFDIDGTNNSFVKQTLVTKRPTNQTTPRKSYWTVDTQTAKTESDAKVKIGMQATELIVINPNKKTKAGNPHGYRLIPGAIIHPLLLEDDYTQIRGAFTNYNVWVTPYNKLQKFAGGKYVDQSLGDDTLAVWTLKNREIKNKDIVMYYVMGFHHVPCQEDYPLMPTLSGGFELRPTNFFEYSAVLKVIPAPIVHPPSCIKS